MGCGGMAGLEPGNPSEGCGSGPGPGGKSRLGSLEIELSAFTKRPSFPVKDAFLKWGLAL